MLFSFNIEINSKKKTKGTNIGENKLKSVVEVTTQTIDFQLKIPTKDARHYR